MIVYRLCKAAYVALDGEGARLWGGRWNSAGRPMIYTAASPSLAVLEVLVHLDLPSELLPNDYQLLTIAVPDDVPVGRIDHPILDDHAFRQAGDAFLADAVALALIMPSVVVPQERNVLLNPAERSDATCYCRTHGGFPDRSSPGRLKSTTFSDAYRAPDRMASNRHVKAWKRGGRRAKPLPSTIKNATAKRYYLDLQECDNRG